MRPRIPAKIAAEGQFTDKANIKHTWQVNGAHALVWDGKPYLPIGGAFTPHSLGDTSEAAWQNDARALDAIQARGVQDILLWPDKPLCDLSPASVQRVLDYLDAKGFHYGVAWGPGMTQMTAGYVVKPSVYRKDARPNTNADPLLTTDWISANTDRGVVVMYDGASDSKVFRDTFEIPVGKDGVVSVPVEAPNAIAHPYVMLLPHKLIPAGEQGALPDVWGAFDTYRDRVLHFAKQIKWGPGLRFFLDPLARHVAVTGENALLVPDSAAYRLEWESFLARKYGDAENARIKWALMDRIPTFTQLARLVPLWARVGPPYFYDPQTRRVFRMLDGSQSAQNSQWWNDFIAHRDATLGYYLNTLADVMKRQAANVPVVYTWTPSTTFLTNLSKEGGFDGLAVATRPGEPSRVARVFGPAYSQSEQATRTSWFLTSEIVTPPPPLLPFLLTPPRSFRPRHSPTPTLPPRPLLCHRLTPTKAPLRVIWTTCGASAAKGSLSAVCNLPRCLPVCKVARLARGTGCKMRTA